MSSEEKEEDRLKNSVPCIICDKELDHVFHQRPPNVLGDELLNQPSDGLVFRSNGNYGSTIFDPINDFESLEIAICDDCIKEKRKEKKVLMTITTRVSPKYTIAYWDRKDDW